MGVLVRGLGVDNPRALFTATGADLGGFVATAFEGRAPVLTPGLDAYETVARFAGEVGILAGFAVKREVAQDSLLLEDAAVVLKRRREEAEGAGESGTRLGARPTAPAPVSYTLRRWTSRAGGEPVSLAQAEARALGHWVSRFRKALERTLAPSVEAADLAPDSEVHL